MSLKRNILFNYISQIYVTLIGIVLVPLYMKNMGPEAYGLVGFFAMLQSWFGMLDLGLTPTISRETARYRGGALSALTYRQLFRSLSLIFVSVATVGGTALLILSDLIATRWLNAEALSHSDVVIAVQIMAVSVALRWMGGLYRGVVIGSERLDWISSFNAFVATLRFVGVLVSMQLLGFTPLVFFGHQLVIAFLELLGLFLMSRRLLPANSDVGVHLGWSLRPVKPYLKFALSIALTSSIWILVTQTDKFLLSGILPLGEYGYFTMAVLAASGVTIVSGPISNAIMPRMAKLNAEGNKKELFRVYRNSTRFVSAIAGAASISLAFCAQPFLYAWTGSFELASNVSAVLALYAIGNGILAMGAFPYYLQYAKGDLKYHLIGHFSMLFIMIPATVYGALKFGSIGAGFSWVGINSVYLLFWVAYVHKKIAPGLHFSWLMIDVVAVSLPAVILAYAIDFFLPVNLSSNGDFPRWNALAQTLAFSSAIVLCSVSMYSIFKKNHEKI